MSLSTKARDEILVNASITDQEDDISKPTLKRILNQTAKRPPQAGLHKWMDKRVVNKSLTEDEDNVTVWRGKFKKKNNTQTNGRDTETCIWEAPIFFIDNEFQAAETEVICIKDVLVAACPEESENYGNTFVYVGLPAYLRTYLDYYLDKDSYKMGPPAEPLVFNDARFFPDDQMWWRTVRSVENLAMTIATNDDGDAVKTSHSVAEILKKTGKGFTIAAHLMFTICAKTTDGNKPKKGVVQTVAVDVLYGVLQDLNDSREGPMLVSGPPAADPSTKGPSMNDTGFVRTNNMATRDITGGNKDRASLSLPSQSMISNPGHLFAIPPSFWEVNSRLLAQDSGSLPWDTTIHPSLYPVFLALRTNQTPPRAF